MSVKRSIIKGVIHSPLNFAFCFHNKVVCVLVFAVRTVNRTRRFDFQQLLYPGNEYLKKRVVISHASPLNCFSKSVLCGCLPKKSTYSLQSSGQSKIYPIMLHLPQSSSDKLCWQSNFMLILFSPYLPLRNHGSFL